MAGLFGSKWERENGDIAGARFYEWADIIEPMPSDQIRRRFNELEARFKRDVSLGKDIWPPTIALFMALASQPRVNEDAYKEFTYELPRYTKADYQEKAARGMNKINQILKGK